MYKYSNYCDHCHRIDKNSNGRHFLFKVSSILLNESKINKSEGFLSGSKEKAI